MTEKSNQSASDLRRRIQEKTKNEVRRGMGTYQKCFEKNVKDAGVPGGPYQLNKLIEAEKAITSSQHVDVAEILECPSRTSIAYRIRIGDSAWSLRAEKSGLKLHLEYRPYCAEAVSSSISDIGLFQVLQTEENLSGRPHKIVAIPGTSKKKIVLAPKGTGDHKERNANVWAVCRYGTYLSHRVEFMTKKQVEALSYHFGIPFHYDIGSHDQRVVSEKRFLTSPAFKQLRTALRTGRLALPDISDWNSGLSPAWCHLVAMSDISFAEVDTIVDDYFMFFSGTKEDESLKRLERQWEQVPTLGQSGAGLEYGFIERMRSWKCKNKRRSSSTTR